MAPMVVRIEPNGCQDFLSHDDAIDDLKAHGWDVFLKKFEGYNLQVAKYFAQTFDGFRAKIGDIQLELTEDFMSKVTGLPLKGERWFKNAKLEDVPWSLFMASRETTCCTKGIPIALLKPRWHSLLLILKQFVTCEGRYGLVFLYHIRLLMNFIGFELDMPFYLLMSLYKMSKRYKRQGINSSLFHHGLVKILLVYHLSKIGDNWETFLIRNGFTQADATVNPLLIINPNSDRPVTEIQVVNSIDGPEFIESVSVVDETPVDKELPCRFSPGRSLEQVIVELKEKDRPVPMNDSSLNVNDKPIVKNFRKGKKPQSTDLSFKNKNVGRLISRKLRNRKSNHLSSIDLIEIDDRCSYREIDDFLAREDPKNQCSRREVITHDEQYDFVTNLPPCLKGKEGFLGIGHNLEQTTGKNEAPLVDCDPRRSTITPVHCDSCLDWIERYYTDVPLLQARVKRLAAQNALLKQENLDLKAHTERENKRFKRVGI
jgi:hypothetical protein